MKAASYSRRGPLLPRYLVPTVGVSGRSVGITHCAHDRMATSTPISLAYIVKSTPNIVSRRDGVLSSVLPLCKVRIGEAEEQTGM